MVKPDITKHVLVPEHTIMTSDEIEELFKKYSIKKINLPKISVRDPVVKYIGAKEGDIIKIVRKSHTAGISVYYRYVAPSI